MLLEKIQGIRKMAMRDRVVGWKDRWREMWQSREEK